MIRFLLRTFGVLCLAASFVAVVVDGTRSIAARELVWTDLGTSIGQISEDAAHAVQAASEKSSDLGDVLILLLAQPTAVLFGILGVLLLLIGRRRHRRHVGFAT